MQAHNQFDFIAQNDGLGYLHRAFDEDPFGAAVNGGLQAFPGRTGIDSQPALQVPLPPLRLSMGPVTL